MDITTRTNAPLVPGNGIIDTTLSKAAVSIHGAVDRVAGAANEAVSTVNPAIDRVAQGAHHAVNSVAHVAGPATAWLRAQGSCLKTAQQKAAADTAQAISAHPWKALGIALAAGFLISRLAR